MVKTIGDTTGRSIFIASSVEGLSVAYAIQENLTPDAEVTVWPQGVFDLSKTAMQSLADKLENTEFGIFVFTPDDISKIRGRGASTVRDNVVLEFGLFAGRLGIERTYIVMPENCEDLHLPTDLLGITPGKYKAKRSDGNLAAALGPFCNQVRKAIKRIPLANKASKKTKKPQARESAKIPGLAIHSAMYGIGPHRLDVKNAILKELHAKDAAFIGNQLAGDPAPTATKNLVLDFSYKGIRKLVEIPEGGTLAFPGVPAIAPLRSQHD